MSDEEVATNRSIRRNSLDDAGVAGDLPGLDTGVSVLSLHNELDALDRGRACLGDGTADSAEGEVNQEVGLLLSSAHLCKKGLVWDYTKGETEGCKTTVWRASGLNRQQKKIFREGGVVGKGGDGGQLPVVPPPTVLSPAFTKTSERTYLARLLRMRSLGSVFGSRAMSCYWLTRKM